VEIKFKHIKDSETCWEYTAYEIRHNKEQNAKLSLYLNKNNATQVYEVEVQLHALLTSAPKEVSGQLFPPALYPLRKIPRYSLKRRLGGAQSRDGRDGEKKNF
jgi:hypothetical protein